MTVERVPPPPANFAGQLKQALRTIRIGDYKKAHDLLEPLRKYLPTRPVDFPPTPQPDDYYRLRLATLLAEVAEYRGDYAMARVALQPYERIVEELQQLQRLKSSLDFGDRPREQHLLFRQKLYYLWQTSVWRYRTGAIPRSRELLDLAIGLAASVRPRSETLLTQLYYGAGKLAFHECRESEAMTMYRQSLMSASQRLDIARRAHEKDADAPESDDAFMDNEVEAARYSVAKTLALGLGQCLREQGRLEEAHTQVVAGRLLLSLGPDTELSQYARLLLGSIERSIAGEENKPDLLRHASEQVAECARHFESHEGEVGFRSRLEHALVTMQQKELSKARTMLEKMLEPTPAAKWVAECNLGLSRVARREKAHGEAVELARKSVHAASPRGLERIRRRAQTVLVLALYDAAAAATDLQFRDDLLKETLEEIDRAMAPASDPDVRTRANMLLTKARALKSRDEIARAIDAYKEYEALKPLVEVGRIHELAKTVEKELEAVMNTFRCPADLDPPVYNLDLNLKAMRQYVIARVNRTFRTKASQASALGRTRGALYPKRRP